MLKTSEDPHRSAPLPEVTPVAHQGYSHKGHKRAPGAGAGFSGPSAPENELASLALSVGGVTPTESFPNSAPIGTDSTELDQ